MNHDYREIVDDLRRQILSPTLASRAVGAIEELLHVHQLDQSEIVRLRRLVDTIEREGRK